MGILNRGTQVHYVKTKYKRRTMGIMKKIQMEEMERDAEIEHQISMAEDGDPTDEQIEEWEIERQIEYQEEKAMGMHD